MGLDLSTLTTEKVRINKETGQIIGQSLVSGIIEGGVSFALGTVPNSSKLVQGIMDIVNNYEGEEEIEEANSLGSAGTGASFNAGNNMAYMGKNAFKKKRSLDEQEEEEELSKDVQTIGKILPKVNNKIEWEELLNVLIDKEIPALSLSAKKTFLLNQIKTLGK